MSKIVVVEETDHEKFEDKVNALLAAKCKILSCNCGYGQIDTRDVEWAYQAILESNEVL